MNRVSVIVASHGRPDHLELCVTGIGQLCHSAFEIVVVADAPGVRAITDMGWADRVKLVRFDAPNISAARNLGLAQAAGDLVAFIDDDAVPEPSWLCRLTAPFGDRRVAATGGFVLGRNGVSLQWGAQAVNRLGETIALEVGGDDAFVPDPPSGYVAKTEGTNTAFRRDVLAGLGGFDPCFRYYLDETDVNLRLAGTGARTVLVPRALVHHGFAASGRRRADRTPTDLTEIGASIAVFLRKHADPAEHRAAVKAHTRAQRQRLLAGMVEGRLEPGAVGPLLEGFTAGMRAGFAREITPLVAVPPPTAPFLPYVGNGSGRSVRIAGRSWQGRRMQAEAEARVAGGDIVTLLRFGPSARPHRVRFAKGGWWEQTGGLFGPSDRSEPVFRLATFRARVDREWARIEDIRQCR